MAYEEKRKSVEENGLFSVMKLARILIKKWWLILVFIVVFAIAGFGIAKFTYVPSYSSNIIINANNKSKDIAGSAADYNTQSDTEASNRIANNFKILIQESNDFITAVQRVVKAQTGVEYSKEDLRGMINAEVFTDSSMLNIRVSSSNKELAYAVATAVQSVYTQITDEAFPTATFTVADNATKAELQADSSTLIYTAAGFLIGAVIAFLLIIISSSLNNVVLSSDDIKNNFNINIIATVSKIKIKKNEKKRLLITDKNVGLPFIETFKLIRTKIENTKLKKGYSVFAVTSSTESEGKTTSSTNIALSLAKSGKSVILIDADLRKPAVYKTLGISVEGDKGVFDIISGQKSFEEAVKYVEKFNLYLLVSSTQIADPSEVLSSRGMEAVIKEAKKKFDYVIIDCPPAGFVADAAIISNYADTIIFVTSEEKVTVTQVEYALSDLMTTKAEIMGCIYNCANPRITALGEKSGGYFSSPYGYGGYGYYGYYGSSSHKRK